MHCFLLEEVGNCKTISIHSIMYACETWGLFLHHIGIGSYNYLHVLADSQANALSQVPLSLRFCNHLRIGLARKLHQRKLLLKFSACSRSGQNRVCYSFTKFNIQCPQSFLKLLEGAPGFVNHKKMAKFGEKLFLRF